MWSLDGGQIFQPRLNMSFKGEVDLKKQGRMKRLVLLAVIGAGTWWWWREHNESVPKVATVEDTASPPSLSSAAPAALAGEFDGPSMQIRPAQHSETNAEERIDFRLRLDLAGEAKESAR
jgi:hypothetical protein